MNFDKATEFKEKINEMRPLSQSEVLRLREYEKVEQVYNSNALEGNTITAFETKMILEEGITIASKPLKEHLEIINLSSALDFVEELVKEAQPLTERLIKQIHTIIYDKLAYDTKDIGSYRKIPVHISGSGFVPTEPWLIPIEMEKLIKWSETNKDKLHPIEYAARLHEKFVTIHPFVDGNGRTARLLMNFALTSKGYPPIVVKADPESRYKYNKSLEEAQIAGNLEPFISLINDLTVDKLQSMYDILATKEKMLSNTDNKIDETFQKKNLEDRIKESIEKKENAKEEKRKISSKVQDSNKK